MFLIQFIKLIPNQRVPILIKLFFHYVTQVLIIIAVLIFVFGVGCLCLLLGLWHVFGKLYGLLTGSLFLRVIIPPFGRRWFGCVLHSQLLGILFNHFLFESGL